MSEEVNVATPAEPSAPEPTNTQPTQPTEPAGSPEPRDPVSPQPEKTFSVPEEYQDKEWAKHIKDEQGLWKEVSDLKALKGKKNYIPDFDTATENEIKAFVEAVAPESIDDYGFGEDAHPVLKEKIGEVFKNKGITAHQGKAAIEAYNEIAAQIQQEEYSKDGMANILKESFGDGYEKVSGDIINQVLAPNLSKDDQSLLDAMPNKYLGLVYRLANNVKNSYGIDETGAQVNAKPELGNTADVNQRRSDLRKQIQEISNRKHTHAEKQSLIDELQATYKGAR